MKQKITQVVKTSILGVLTVLLLVLTVLQLLPSPDTGVSLKEPIAVYSELTDATNGVYENAVSGILFNESDDTLKINSITVTLTNGAQDKAIKVYLTDDETALDLPARMQREFSKSELSTVSYTEVKSVEVEINGEAHEISNAPEKAFEFAGSFFVFVFAIVPQIGEHAFERRAGDNRRLGVAFPHDGRIDNADGISCADVKGRTCEKSNKFVVHDIECF